eukprot:CAMPEP_0117431066 /NCGR_PEP_ID=MMETSP0758-20121206/10617_1 /TAXON_ID=63605 /ORGANISM="Percolomonas cosmopolitus, Strain AE-1 (ATCC 50343)" /LENGTH=668 /DNA_ID=CAMNT_0005219737 /DNA_START=1243 /DNA_END=3246 /DNA_ORIENTATION=-
MHFQNVPYGMLLLLRVLTLENWNGLMYNSAIEAPYCTNNGVMNDCGNRYLAHAYYFTFFFIASNIILSLFIGIILDHFSYSFNQAFKSIREPEINHFRSVWQIFDPKATGYIMKEKLDLLMEQMFAEQNNLALAYQYDKFERELYLYMQYELYSGLKFNPEEEFQLQFVKRNSFLERISLSWIKLKARIKKILRIRRKAPEEQDEKVQKRIKTLKTFDIDTNFDDVSLFGNDKKKFIQFNECLIALCRLVVTEMDMTDIEIKARRKFIQRAIPHISAIKIQRLFRERKAKAEMKSKREKSISIAMGMTKPVLDPFLGKYVETDGSMTPASETKEPKDFDDLLARKSSKFADNFVMPVIPDIEESDGEESDVGDSDIEVKSASETPPPVAPMPLPKGDKNLDNLWEKYRKHDSQRLPSLPHSAPPMELLQEVLGKQEEKPATPSSITLSTKNELSGVKPSESPKEDEPVSRIADHNNEKLPAMDKPPSLNTDTLKIPIQNAPVSSTESVSSTSSLTLATRPKRKKRKPRKKASTPIIETEKMAIPDIKIQIDNDNTKGKPIKPTKVTSTTPNIKKNVSPALAARMNQMLKSPSGGIPILSPGMATKKGISPALAKRMAGFSLPSPSSSSPSDSPTSSVSEIALPPVESPADDSSKELSLAKKPKRKGRR